MKKLNILFIAVLILFTGCKKFLDVEPKGKAIPTHFEHYNGLMNNPYLGGFQHLKFTSTSNAETGEINYSFSILGDVSAPFYMSDDLQANPGSFNNFTLVEQKYYRWEDDLYLPEDNSPDWGGLYSLNYAYNLIIAGAMNSEGGTVQQKEALVAEARAVRAYLHFWVAQMFAVPYNEATAASDLGIPMVVNPSTEEKNFTRPSNKALYDFIITELQAAIPKLSETTINRNRLSKLGAQYMLGQVYFQMKKYDLALKEFTATQALLSKSQIPMNLYDYNTKVASWYVPFMSYMGLVNHPNPFDNEENIYVKQSALPIMSAMSTKMILTPAVYSLFGDKDERKKIYASRGIFSSEQLPGVQRAGPGTVNMAPSIPNLLLMKAECEARSGNLTAAQSDLFQLRKNRMPESDAKQAFTEKEPLVKAILDERLREFAATGLRWLDMRRLYDDQTYNNVNTKRVLDGKTYTLRKERLTLRIPPNILGYNANMQNNP